MTPIINSYVFCLLALFGIDGGAYSNQTTITIDRENNTATFHYVRIQSPAEEVDTARKVLAGIGEMTGLHQYYQGLELVEIKKLSSATTDYEIQLKYDSETRLRDYFGIDLGSGTVLIHAAETIKAGEQVIELDGAEPTPKKVQLEGSKPVIEFTRKKHKLFDGFVDL